VSNGVEEVALKDWRRVGFTGTAGVCKERVLQDHIQILVERVYTDTPRPYTDTGIAEVCEELAADRVLQDHIQILVVLFTVEGLGFEYCKAVYRYLPSCT
jgi:hypothetical protein